jgi:hypothetical protein
MHPPLRLDFAAPDTQRKLLTVGLAKHRLGPYVEAMNGLLQQAKRAARGFKTATNFIMIAYSRTSKLKHLPSNPLVPAVSPKYSRFVAW